MGSPVSSDDFEIVVGQTGYLHVNCTKCGSLVRVTYLGTDPTMPELRFECHKDDRAGTFKIFNPTEGFPPSPLSWVR